MSRLNEELRHKYAYNINDSSKAKKISIGSGKDFRQLHRGFYDEIENQDLSIKDKERQLRKIKNDSLKEFVFTNIQIPEKWKKKLTYQNDVIRILAKDNNFLYYIGRSVPTKSVMGETASTKMYTSDNFNNNNNSIEKLKESKTSYGQIFPKIKNKYSSEEKNNLKNDLMNKNEYKTLEEEELSLENTISNSKVPINKLKPNKKEAMNDKDIANLLEEFKLAYPIKSKKEEEPEDSLEEKKVEKNIKNENIFQKKNLLFTKKYNLSSALLQTTKGYNPFDNIHKIKVKRQRAFRQNIFNNLLPPKQKNKSNSMININSNGKFRKIKIKKKDEKYGPFLNFDYESFCKKIKINNPIVERQLENINFYGPYYSYCPPCLNRNLEYYKHLEPNQCLKLIQFIRKMRGKKNIINIKENISNKSENKSKKKISSFDENFNDNETNLGKKESKESIELSQS